MLPNPPSPSVYPFLTHDKLRYADTDRQGHVNKAVFATTLETGRVELSYSADGPLHEAGCSFVIASLRLDFHREIAWPGRVDIGTRVASVGKSSLTLEQALFQDGRCAATARTVIVQVNDASRRSRALSERAVRRLSGFRPQQEPRTP